jgi:hypothetical protein
MEVISILSSKKYSSSQVYNEPVMSLELFYVLMSFLL